MCACVCGTRDWSIRLPNPPLVRRTVRSFEGGAKHVDIAAGAEVVLTTDPAFKDKGTTEKAST